MSGSDTVKRMIAEIREDQAKRCEQDRAQHDALRNRLAFLIGYYGRTGAVPVEELGKALRESKAAT